MHAGNYRYVRLDCCVMEQFTMMDAGLMHCRLWYPWSLPVRYWIEISGRILQQQRQWLKSNFQKVLKTLFFFIINHSHLKVVYIVNQRPSNNTEKTSTIRQPCMSTHLGTVRRKKLPFKTGRNLRQAQGGLAVCRGRLRVMPHLTSDHVLWIQLTES